jgi:hypothetical protein
MDILEATRSYEQWMSRRCPIVRTDIARKHRRMAESAFVFLRGTFYRWAQTWPAVCAPLVRAPRVLAVGDLHVENFGTWRDLEGRLVWGVNDVDEAWVLPYTNDLVRLTASAVLATRQAHLDVPPRESAEAILDGYITMLERGGTPIVLAERRRWLRRIALNDLRDPTLYWSKLDSLQRATGTLPHAVLRAALPDPRLPYRIVRRIAGVGSLGRCRVVALAEWRGARIAREAKAWLPSAAAWAAGAPEKSGVGEALLARAVRNPDPLFAFRGPWIVRRLAPDCSRIEIEELPRARDEEKLLRAMGAETANIHLGTPRAAIRADLRARPARWLERAAIAMADAVETEWREWVKRG